MRVVDCVVGLLLLVNCLFCAFGVVYVVWFTSGGLLICFWWIVDLRVLCLGRVGSVRFSVCGCGGVRVGLRLCFRLFVLYLVGCRLVVWALLSGSFWWIVCGLHWFTVVGCVVSWRVAGSCG